MYKLYEKAGGDLTSSQTKNYAKDPRHLVLLKGFRYVNFVYYLILQCGLYEMDCYSVLVLVFKKILKQVDFYFLYPTFCFKKKVSSSLTPLSELNIFC